MQEIIKEILRLLITTFRRARSRTTETKITAPQSSRERYPSSASEISRITNQEANTSYLALRIPFRSTCRFSVMFPGTLRPFEESYFRGQSWAQYFEDDRPSKKPPFKEGLFLPWTKEAVGTEQLFAAVWQSAQELPNDLAEIHSDGTHLRALFQTSGLSTQGFNTSHIRQSLESLARKVTPLKVHSVSRGSINDILPVRETLYRLGFIVVFLLSIGALHPPVHYASSDQGLVLTGAAGLVLGILTFIQLRVRGLRYALTFGLLATIFGGIFLATLHMRIAYTLREQGVLERWIVHRVTGKSAKYSKEIASYQIALSSHSGVKEVFSVPARLLPNPEIISGKAVEVRWHEDYLRLRFSDSALLDLGDGKTLELVRR